MVQRALRQLLNLELEHGAVKSYQPVVSHLRPRDPGGSVQLHSDVGCIIMMCSFGWCG